jgi:hypothetical protein
MATFFKLSFGLGVGGGIYFSENKACEFLYLSIKILKKHQAISRIDRSFFCQHLKINEKK